MAATQEEKMKKSSAYEHVIWKPIFLIQFIFNLFTCFYFMWREAMKIRYMGMIGAITHQKMNRYSTDTNIEIKNHKAVIIWVFLSSLTSHFCLGFRSSFC